MKINETASAIEGILFASGTPVPAERIAKVLGVPTEDVLKAADTLANGYVQENRGLRLVHLNGSLQLCSAPELAGDILRAMEQRRPPQLSQAALEALAITAYFQPVTRAYIEKLRGVDSSYTVGLLTERGLIEPCGKLEAPGRPTLFRTTDAFLRVMGISSLEELPELPDITTDEGMAKLQATIEAMKNPEETQQLAMEEVQ